MHTGMRERSTGVIWLGDPLPTCMIFAEIFANFYHWQMRTSRGRGVVVVSFHFFRSPFSLYRSHKTLKFCGILRNSMSPLPDFLCAWRPEPPANGDYLVMGVEGVSFTVHPKQNFLHFLFPQITSESVLLAAAGDWCWSVVRENYCWLAGGWCWFGVRKKYY